jgi:maltokinase
MTPADLSAARWFRSKQLDVTAVVEVDRAALTPTADLVVVEVSYRDAPQHDRYLLVVADGGEPADGDGAWTALAAAMRDARIIDGSSGRFIGQWTGAVALDGMEGERRLNVEQSNTSVVIGERLILKLYRLLEPGENPDLEVSAFVTDAGFAGTPALAGSMVYRSAEGWTAAVAMLQEFVPSTGDAWTAMLDALAADPAAGIDMAAAIGRITAALHQALASRPEHPAFPARPATVAETAAWRASAERQLAQAVTAVSGEAHRLLVELAPAVRARFADTFGVATGEARVTRIHGDYHLGQLLARRDAGFSVIDFEGEPARPIAERRQPSSPLRDVAGMLRSLDYAARTAQRTTRLEPEPWLDGARAAFLDAYGPTDPALLAAFELEKACYEVRYEASNRPAWLWLPLAAVERLAR